MNFKEICGLPHSQAGTCLAQMVRFTYNAEINKCIRFSYGSCKGNANNFKSKKDCEKMCVENKQKEEEKNTEETTEENKEENTEENTEEKWI